MRGVRLPRGDLALARLARRRGRVQRLADGLEDRLLVEAEERADAAAADGPRWATWSILCACSEIAFTRSIWISYPVAMPRRTSRPVSPRFAARCCATAMIGGMSRPGASTRGEEGVVEVEFAHGDAVGRRRPLGARAARGVGAEDRGAVAADRDRVGEGLAARGHDRPACEGGRGDGRVVDDPVDDHVDDVVVESTGSVAIPRASRRAGPRARGSRRSGACEGGGSSRPHALESR